MLKVKAVEDKNEGEWRRQKKGEKERQTKRVYVQSAMRQGNMGKKGSMRVRLRGLVKELLKRKRREKGAL